MRKITIDMFKTDNGESIPGLSSAQEQVLEFLRAYHGNKENPIKGPKLIDRCDDITNDTELRVVVNSLRILGFKVNSDTRGYWYSTDQEDIQITINQLTQRICGISNAINGLRTKPEPKKYFIQGKMEIEEIEEE